MPKVPEDIEKWDASCLAKYILKHWEPSGISGGAMRAMAEYDPQLAKAFCGIFLPSQAHPDTPPEILAELKRRASL